MNNLNNLPKDQQELLKREALQEVINSLNLAGGESSEIKEVIDKMFDTAEAKEIFRTWGIDRLDDFEQLLSRDIVDKMMEQGIFYLRMPLPGEKRKLREGQKKRPAPVNADEANERAIERLQRTVEGWFKTGMLKHNSTRPYRTSVREFKKFLIRKYLNKFYKMDRIARETTHLSTSHKNLCRDNKKNTTVPDIGV